MITRADVAKLGALHAVEPAMLSLYLAVPSRPANLPALIARAGELIAAAEAVAGRVVEEQVRGSVREKLAACARDWPGRTLAFFGCAGSGLFEVIPLPCAQPERAVLGTRPHVRPLLAALPSGPATDLTGAGRAGDGPIVTGLAACLAAVSAGAAAALVVPRDGLVPGYECGRCGALSLDPDSCPDWGTAPLPVPDVIEEMVSRVLEDGGEVVVTCDGSRRVAARLQSGG